MGLTATPEFGFNAATESVANGPTRNPWDTDRSPGGSSGGSAALVAARALPAAHASDGGGSIRIPAASCGLVGLKPTRGRTTVGPDYSDPLLGLGIEFAVARTVRDVAGLLDAVHGSEPGDRYVLLPPATTFLDAARRVFNATTRAVAGFFTEHDLLLTPTAAAPNTAIGHLDANDTSLDARGWYDRIFTFAACTSLSNVTGAPAISVPGPPSPEGWPVGVQLVGRHGVEETLLGVAAMLEQALPWSGRRPAVVAS
jgi:Asp-tRNA(Asn)/Glu-tRNA(Gln) amidotransferase A subunit family amidase